MTMKFLNETIFLTGFPGFIAGRLVKRLAEDGARFLLLVQPAFMTRAYADISRIASETGTSLDRFRIIEGDITRPDLGLFPSDLKMVREETTVLFHLAAIYDLAVARDVAMRVNVEGTRHVNRLAQTLPRLRRYHYVSTCYVAGKRTGVILETELRHDAGFRNYYEEPKYLAELEVDALKSQLPITIHRPAVVCGDSRTGETAKYDGIYYLINYLRRQPSLLSLANIGNNVVQLNVVPVDFVVEAMVALAQDERAVGATVHLADPHPLNTHELFETIARSLTGRGSSVSIPEKLVRAMLSLPFSETVTGLPRVGASYFLFNQTYDTTRVRALLEPHGVRCPTFPSYLNALLEFLNRKNRTPLFFPQAGRMPVRAAEDVAHAVKQARAAQRPWDSLSFRERAGIVMRARQIVLEEIDEIAHLISHETGKPVAEAISMEIVPTLDLMRYFAKNTARLLKPEKIDIGLYAYLGRTSHIIYHSLGVVGIVSPWNFPWAIPVGEVVMALMAGNAVVLKPSELVPLTGLKIGEVFARAGLPDGLLKIVTGDGAAGAALVEAGADKIMFTGSVATGKRVAEAAARRLTPVVLELGGKDPMIVLPDANIELAAHAAVWGAFANCGQACASVERCYVHVSVVEEFTRRVVEITRTLRQDYGTREDTDIGAMSSERQLERVESHVREAEMSGARVLAGGGRSTKLAGLFFEPTVLTGVNHSMRVMRDETFGPVLPIQTFTTDEEAIRLANDSAFGLTASVWTRDVQRGRRLAQEIEAGTVTVGELLYTYGIAQTPWGGAKESGRGFTHGRLGLLELVRPQHIHTNHFAIPNLWWFRYTPAAAELFRGFARRFASGSVLQTMLLTPQIIRRFFDRFR